MNDAQLMEYLLQIIEDCASAIEGKDLTKDRAAKELADEIAILLNRFDLAAQEVIPKQLILEYFGGVDEATMLLAEAGAVSFATPFALTAAGEVTEAFQTRLHMDALEVLLTDTMESLEAAVRSAHLSTVDSIETTLKKVKADLNKGVIQGDPRKVIQAQVMKSFREDGMKVFFSKNDARLPLDFYAMTVTRTKLREAAVTGSVNRYQETGQDLVQLIENSDTCEICSRLRNMVVSLRGETEGFPVVGQNGVKLPPLHPNCRGSVVPFVIEFKGEEEIQEAKKRNEQYSPTKDMRTPAQRRAYQKEQEARRIANAEKKQFMRWQALLGAEAPKTLGAFRRMKRQNTAKYQELQSLYRSAAMTGRGIG